MGHTICLLTAALLTGQTGQNNVTYQTKIIVPPSETAVQQSQGKAGVLTKISVWWDQNRPNIIPRLQKRFGAVRRPMRSPYYPQYTPRRPLYRKKIDQPMAADAVIRPKSTEPPLAEKETKVKFHPVTNSKTKAIPGLQLSPEVAHHCGNDTKSHKWITGELHKHGRVWVLVYAGENVVDRYDGRVALPNNIDMSRFKTGDLVSVSGHVQNQQVGGMHVYHVDTILPVEIPRK